MTKLGESLGKRIRQVRESRKLTQAQLAAATRKTVETISNFERGKTIPSVQSLSALAKALSISIADLFAYDHELPIVDDLYLKLKGVADEDRELLEGFVALLQRRHRSRSGH